MQPYTLETLFGFSLQQRLQIARRLYADQGKQLLALEALQQHLGTLSLLQMEVRQCMEKICMPAFCRACAQASTTGGCCSRAMTDENDAVLLLLNLLAGGPVELQRNDKEECLFLGADGCTLLFKPFFCLNYICRKLHDGAQPAMRQKLAKASGRLLQQQYATEQFLLWILQGMLQKATTAGKLLKNR